jgi:RNA recognition motif-containing protein
MAKIDNISNIAGVNSYDSLHPRKLFISGLSKIYNTNDVDIRRAQIERAFAKYGGARGAHVIIPIKSTFAFVEFESSKQADVALSEMSTNNSTLLEVSSKYRLNRARRSKHEALQEERTAKERNSGTTASTIDREWN